MNEEMVASCSQSHLSPLDTNYKYYSKVSAEKNGGMKKKFCNL